ncbi:MAG TPA: hypothetical protein VF791_07310 [Pyrinomonadaceae bacterium]
MKRVFSAKSIIAAVLALVVLSAISLAGAASTTPRPVTKTYQFRCTDRNQSLYIVIYEQDGKISNGHMYLENMQVANLTAAPYGSTGNIEAKVVGNTADVRLQLFEDRILVANYITKKREVVCQSTRKYQ